MLGVADHLSEAARNLRHGGTGVVREFLSRSYLRRVPASAPDPVFDDWDLLVVLDACRADLFEEVVGEHDRFAVGETRISPGSTSPEWMEGAFGTALRETLDDTAYVSGNPYTRTHVGGSRLALLDEVWRYAWDDELGTIPPRPITDRAITVGRNRAPDRLVVHYMQPHFPTLESGDGVALDRFGEESLSVWEELRFGERDPAEVWDHYATNLRAVLEEVELLLENVDAERAVVTADHGNAVGERSIYGHAAGIPLPCLREVPWCETTATDHGEYDPERYDRDGAGSSARDRLAQLGYV